MVFIRDLEHPAEKDWHALALPASGCTINMLVPELWIACYTDECLSQSLGDRCHSLVKACLSFMWSLLLPLHGLCWPAISDSNLISPTSVMGYFFHYFRDLIYRVNSITWKKEFFMTWRTSSFWRLTWCWLFILVVSKAWGLNFSEWQYIHMLVLFLKDMKYCMFSHFSYTTVSKNDLCTMLSKTSYTFVTDTKKLCGIEPGLTLKRLTHWYDSDCNRQIC